MTNDWETTCKLASQYVVQVSQNELLLFKTQSDLTDGFFEFPIGSGLQINVPFRPWVLVSRASKKDDVVAAFGQATRT